MRQLSFLILLGLLALSASCDSAGKEPAGTNIDSGLTTFFLVRHAEKATDGTSDPSLTKEGEIRAQRLAELLKVNGVEAIYSTPFQRTKQTAEPLASNLNLPIQEYDHKAENLAETLIQTNQGKTVLVVGHSNSTPTLINNLIGEEKFQELDESVYNKLFIVTIGNGAAKALVLEY